MNLLDRLLGQNWESQVRSTFLPKRYNTLSSFDFTPGSDKDNDLYNKYKNLLDEGYMLTEKGWDEFTKTSGAAWKKALNPDATRFFSDFWISPEQLEARGPVDIFDPASIIKGFETSGMSDVDESMVKPFQVSDVRKIDPASYTKQIESGRSDLSAQLQSRLASASGAGSGFSGYGGRSTAQDLALQQYEQGSADLFAEANKARAGAVKNLYSQLEDFDKLIDKAT